MFYGYLNLESTKTKVFVINLEYTFYGYLNLESTKTAYSIDDMFLAFYGYLNLESTKTPAKALSQDMGFTVT